MSADPRDREEEPLLRVRGLRRQYVTRRGWSHRRRRVRALDGVDLTVEKGTALALVGETASGKSTLARCLALLERPDSGSIRFRGRDLPGAGSRGVGRLERRRLAGQIQLIFQDPASALNPRFSAAEIVAEPLRVQRLGDHRERRRRALEAMEQVGLLPRWADRRPAQLSGGQRQRLAIARALVLEPALLILDEALSALDLAVQARIANLLLELQAARGLTYVLVSHDLQVAGHLADEVAVLQAGKIVERGPAESVFRSPKHAHTRQLIDATPVLEPPAVSKGSRRGGEVASAEG